MKYRSRYMGVIEMNDKFRKFITVTLLIISILSAGIAVYAHSIPSETKFTQVTESYEMTGSLKTSALFTNESIYGSSGSMEYYPESIVKEIVGNYSFTADSGFSGNYEMNIGITYYVKDGKKSIVLWNETYFSEKGEVNGDTSIEFSIITSELKRRLEAVKDGTGISRVQQSVRLDFRAQSDEVSFEHSMNLVKRSGLYSFSNTEKTLKDRKVSETVRENYISGIEVNNARILYAGLSLSALIPALAINRNSISSRGKRNMEKGVMVVNGRKVGDRILLDSFNDLKKVYQLSDSPIIKSKDVRGDVYTIEVNGITYEYRA